MRGCSFRCLIECTALDEARSLGRVQLVRIHLDIAISHLRQYVSVCQRALASMRRTRPENHNYLEGVVIRELVMAMIELYELESEADEMFHEEVALRGMQGMRFHLLSEAHQLGLPSYLRNMPWNRL